MCKRLCYIEDRFTELGRLYGDAIRDIPEVLPRIKVYHDEDQRQKKMFEAKYHAAEHEAAIDDRQSDLQL